MIRKRPPPTDSPNSPAVSETVHSQSHVTGAFAGGGDHAAVKFDWNGNDEMDEARSSGWAEIQADGSRRGKISLHGSTKSP